MSIPFFHIDAFANERFKGNPAGVCVLRSWPDDLLLLKMAAEHNLSETAFLLPLSQGRYSLRWFSPVMEIDLCGHATLASAYTVFSFLETNLASVSFETRSGLLTVERNGEIFSMDFPSRLPEPAEPPPVLAAALGAVPKEVWKSRDLMAVFRNEAEVRELKPDFAKFRELSGILGVIATAPGERSDFVSRFFAPSVGVDEDPVTGSSHSTLIPYWSAKLGKKALHAFQLSSRGGELFCEDQGDRVVIGGHCVLYSKGEIYLP